MKRALLYFPFFIFHFAFCSAQNLVPNYSFEDTIHCPNYPQFTGYVGNWGGGYPTYFSKYCSQANDGSVPQNAWGYQFARTGNAYAGIYTYIDSAYSPSDAEIRDYLQIQLSSTLVASTKYFVTFYVNLGDSLKYACNDIGAYFSDSTLNYSSWKVKTYLTPQVANNRLTNPLTNKINWTKVSGSFVAVGGEKYMVIGNFKNDRNSDTVFVNSSGSNAHIWTCSFYYVDDVIVTTDSNYADSISAVQEVAQGNKKIMVYPNPANTILNVQVQLNMNETANICLYNSLGERVKCETLKSQLSTLNITDLSTGLYYYRITDSKGTLIKADKQLVTH